MTPNELWQVGTSTVQFEVEAHQREPTTRFQQSRQLVSAIISNQILDIDHKHSNRLTHHLRWGYHGVF